MLRRVFIPSEQIGNEIKLDSNASEHLFKVLRLKAGDKFLAVTEDGLEYESEILSVRERTAQILVKHKLNESRKKIHIYQALIKPVRFEVAIERCCEFGLSSITPIITERTGPYTLSENKKERLKKVMEQAIRQSESPILPKLCDTLTFEAAIKNLPSGVIAIIGDLNGADSLPQYHGEELHLLVGPEGGFSEKEILIAENAGVYKLKICDTTLRSETAAIALTTLASQLKYV